MTSTFDNVIQLLDAGRRSVHLLCVWYPTVDDDETWWLTDAPPYELPMLSDQPEVGDEFDAFIGDVQLTVVVTAVRHETHKVRTVLFLSLPGLRNCVSTSPPDGLRAGT
jgi:hypothetical protein